MIAPIKINNPRDFKQSFSLLVKPTSSDCNLACPYCFYLDKCRLYPEVKHHRMSDDVLERLIETYMATEQPVYSIGWQGGEPTLMGVSFFEKVTRLEQKYGRDGAIVSNSLQTNATLIDDDMARHFANYHFLVGCSLDGPEELHDHYRLTKNGGPTHKRALAGIRLLEKHHADTNILTLVSQANVKHAARVYGYLCDQGFGFHQYIPCVEHDERGEPREFTITGEQWGNFLSELFDVWYENDTERVSIRYFDALLARLVDESVNICQLDSNCRQYLVVEYNGDVYPCDFFVDKRLRLGNVMTDSLEEIWNSDKFVRFGESKARWNRVCEQCEVLELCGGDCLKNRMSGGGPPDTLSWLCAGYKRFLAYTRERFEALARRIRLKRLEERGPIKVGRNDPCPCGSNRKYKKCCGR